MPEAVGSPESDGRPVYWPLSASGILDDSVVEDREDEGRAVAAAPRESPVSAAGSEAATHAGSAASLNQASDRRSDPLPEGRERDGPKVEREDYFGIKAWQQRYAAGASASEEGPATYMDADSVLATDVPGLRPSHDSAESPAQVAFTHYDTQQQQQSKLGATSSSRSSSSNMFHGLVFSGGTGTGTGANTEDVSVSVRDMDVGNLSYDTLSFAADRMMALGQSSLVDLNNTEDLLKDIFGDDDVDSESEVDEQELPGRVDKSRYPPLTADAERYSDSESNSDDFDGVFGLP